MIPTVIGGRWIRNRPRNRTFAVIWGSLSAAAAIFAIAALLSGLQAGKIVGGLVVFALFFVAATIAARYALGCRGAGLLVTKEKVVIKNPWKSYDVPVSEVVRFTAGRQASQYGNPTPGILVELRGGSARAVWTLARDGFVWNSATNVVRWELVAHELNELLRSGV